MWYKIQYWTPSTLPGNMSPHSCADIGTCVWRIYFLSTIHHQVPIQPWFYIDRVHDRQRDIRQTVFEFCASTPCSTSVFAIIFATMCGQCTYNALPWLMCTIFLRWQWLCNHTYVTVRVMCIISTHIISMTLFWCACDRRTRGLRYRRLQFY